MLNHIVPECYIDTMLVEAVLKVAKGKRLNHQHGCFNVERELQKGELKDKFGIGIIDKDKKSIKYLNEFFVVKDISDQMLALWRHKNSNVHHYFIQICPAIEKWILDICEDCSIDLSALGLPKDLNKLKRITKAQVSVHDERFKRLFRAMLQFEHTSIKRLDSWLNVLLKENYNLDIKKLTNG